MRKLGVFICHCGVNIAGTVDVKSVAERIGKVEDVANSTDYIYMCSEPGQQTIPEAIRGKGVEGGAVAAASSADYIYMCAEPGQQTIREAIREKGLDGVVVACCSPNMHENTFRKAVKSEGMNPFLCEIANIREQCRWGPQK